VITIHAEHPPAAVAENSVRSTDGTRISFRRLGNGPALVLVHGSISTHTDWMGVAKLLCDRHTCFVMDRRGHARSAAGASPYSIEREAEDIAAVLAVAGPGAFLAAHPFGAICAMEAALRHPVPRLALYEPPLPAGGLIAGEYLAPYAAAIARGDLDTALEIGLSKFTRLSAPVIAAMRASKAWPRLRTLASTWTRELGAIDSLPSSLRHYAALTCPILLLRGSLSPEHPLQDASRALAEVLPNARVETLMGSGHMALRDDPQAVALLIGDFLAEKGTRSIV
jgi:pimeloyl-ACP methyl ester carboxylesterase